ncbi:MAG: alpha/beta fold hydrolase, partial [Myxococcales bacterium]|nr:alpha/beta fold hydrolase [Myxococcales bacterium]
DGGQDVRLTTADGVTIAATYWPGPAGDRGCVVMVHQLSSTRAEWAPFVARLRGRAHLMTIDLRGHGQSTAGPDGALSWKDFTTDDWAAADQDVTAATAWLSDHGADGDRCVLVGASIGSSVVLRWAASHGHVPGVALLSPGLGYRGLDTTAAAKAYPGLALVVRSEERGAEDAATFLERTWGDRVVMRVVPGTSHGVRTANDDPGVIDAVVDLVDRALQAR